LPIPKTTVLDSTIPVSIPPTFTAVSRYSVYRYTGIGGPNANWLSLMDSYWVYLDFGGRGQPTRNFWPVLHCLHGWPNCKQWGLNAQTHVNCTGDIRWFWLLHHWEGCKYCNECLSDVCLLTLLENHMLNFTRFLCNACCLWPWFGLLW